MIMDTSKLQGLFDEKYEIAQQEPYEGGFAYVYKGKHLKLKDHVALKVLKPKYAYVPQWRELFVGEAVNLRKVSHPNVVRVHDILKVRDNDTSHDMIVMEWVDGKKLSHWRQENAYVDASLLLKIAEQICNAVKAIHTNQLAHHDITPFNIMISPRDEAKLIDFGLSWAVSYDEPTPYPKYGVCLYLAPEQLDHQPSKGIEADIFGLGATLYYLFSGLHYLLPDIYNQWVAYRSGSQYTQHVSTDEIRQAILNKQPDFQSFKESFPATYSEGIVNILKLMLHRSASDRPSIDQVIDSIREIKSPGVMSLTKTQSQSDEISPSLTAASVSPVGRNFRLWTAKQMGENIDFILIELKELANAKLRSGDLYLPPESNNIIGVFVTDESQSSLYFDKFLYVSSQPFQLTFSVLNEANPSVLELVSDGINERIVASQISSQNSSKILRVVPSEIMFVIDDSLGQQFEKVHKFIIDFAQKLKNESHVAFIGAIFYGEYRKYGISTPSLQPTEYLPLRAWGTGVQEILNKKAQVPPQYENKGFCSALEYALSQLANNHDKIWLRNESVKHVILLGMSPPHPMPEERENFGLLDFTADEFDNIDWKTQIETLKSQQIVLSALWLSPNFEIKFKGVEQYARHVWSSFNLTGEFNVFSEVTALNLVWNNVQKSNLSPFKLSSPLILPMLNPLYDPFS